MNDDPIGRSIHVPGRRSYRLVAIAAAFSLAIGGVVAIVAMLDDVPDSMTTVDPSTSPGVAPTPGPTTASPPASPPPGAGAAPLAPTPATSSVVSTVPAPPLGRIGLGADDLIARRVDGDVYLYPGALGDAPGDPVLLIDRQDPRPAPGEGEGPNIVDRVAGTVDGTLIYSDCCEPVSGNLLALTDPDGEQQLFGVGGNPRLEPDGVRLLASNLDFLNLIDLASSTQQFVSTSGSFVDPAFNTTGAPYNVLDATWGREGTVLVLGWSEGEGVIVVEYPAGDIRDEQRRVVLLPATADGRTIETLAFFGVVGDLIGIAREEADGSSLLYVDTQLFNTIEVEQFFEIPTDFTGLQWSIDGQTMAWLVDDTAFLQQIGGQPTAWQTGLAEVWFPVAVQVADGDRGVVPCPTTDVEDTRTADLDGDGTPETVMVLHPGGTIDYFVSTCASTLEVDTVAFESANKPLSVIPFDADGDRRDELWIGASSGSGLCVTLYQLDGTVLAPTELSGCFGGPSESLGCENVDGISQLLHYEYRFVGGSFIEDSDSMIVTTRVALDGRLLDERVLVLPDQADEANRIVSLQCNGRPIIG